MAITVTGELSKNDKAVVQSIAEEYRTLTFLTMDVTKTNFTLRGAEVPGGPAPGFLMFHKPPVDDVLDKGIKTSVAVYAGAFYADAVGAFIDAQRAGGYEKFTPLRKAPMLALIREEKEEEEAAPKMSITEKRAAQREREKTKRQEMDDELNDMF